MFCCRCCSSAPTNRISVSGLSSFSLPAIESAGKIWPPVPPPLIITLSFLYSMACLFYSVINLLKYIHRCLYVILVAFIKRSCRLFFLAYLVSRYPAYRQDNAECYAEYAGPASARRSIPPQGWQLYFPPRSSYGHGFESRCFGCGQPDRDR